MSYERTKLRKTAKLLKKEKRLDARSLAFAQDRAEEIIKENSVKISINRFRYHTYKEINDYGDKEICLMPLNRKGDTACSSVPFNSIQYSNGGRTFQKAVDFSKQIKKIMKENEDKERKKVGNQERKKRNQERKKKKLGKIS